MIFGNMARWAAGVLLVAGFSAGLGVRGSEEEYLQIGSMTVVYQATGDVPETTLRVEKDKDDKEGRLKLVRVTNKDFDLTMPAEALKDVVWPQLETMGVSMSRGRDKSLWVSVRVTLGNPKPGEAWDFPVVYLNIKDGKFAGRNLHKKVDGEMTWVDWPVEGKEQAFPGRR